MKSSILFLAAGSLTAWAAAVPDAANQPASAPFMVTEAELEESDDPSADNSFSLGEIINDAFSGDDAIAEMIKARAKFGGTLPSRLSQAVDTNPDLNSKFKSFLHMDGDTGTVAAYPPKLFDVQYVVPAFIGTPPQITYLNLDTGSSDLWTISTDTYEAQVGGQYVYSPGASSTSKRLDGHSWSIRYGDGAAASGIVYTDVFQLGATYFDAQAVQSAVEVSASISEDSFSSGILGMAKSGANTVRPNQQRTYLDNIKDELLEPIFTVNLQKGRPGNYNFGYINRTEFQGPIQYAPSRPGSTFWEITVSGFQVGSGQYQANPWNAIVDTGTTLLLVSDDIAEAYYSQIPGAGFNNNIGMYLVPCQASLPDFVFGIDSYRGRIPGSYIKYGQASPFDCYGGIQSNEGLNVAIIGDILIKAQFVVFDAGRDVVGFANKQTF